MGVTTRQQGKARDQQLLQLIGRLGFVRTDQAARLMFSGREGVARRRLLALTRRGLLRRCEVGRFDGYVYHLPGRRPGRTLTHTLGVVELYCQLTASTPTGTVIERWAAECQAGDLRLDALAIVRARHRMVAIAIEWGESLTPAEAADKARRLITYAQGEHRRSSWWRPGMTVVQAFVVPEEELEPMRAAVAAASPADHRWVVLGHQQGAQMLWAAVRPLVEDEAAQEGGVHRAKVDGSRFGGHPCCLWLLPAPALAAPPYESGGGFSGLVGLISGALRQVTGLAREASRPPTPMRPQALDPDPIFGMFPGPSRLARYVAQGQSPRMVLEAIRRNRYERLPEVGSEYSAVRTQLRQEMLSAARPGAADLRALTEDSRTPSELAQVLNRMTKDGVRWRDYETERVFQWAQGRLRYLSSNTPKGEVKGKQKPPPPPPPAVTAQSPQQPPRTAARPPGAPQPGS